MKTRSLLGVLAACFLVLTPARGQVPQLINYRGGIALGETNYSGSGRFKFALVSADGARSYWSNDGTSTNGAQPAKGLSLEVEHGAYDVLLGDTNLPNMTAIPPEVFRNPGVNLRVWFSDGIVPFGLVTPDQPIAAVGYAMIAAGVADGAVGAAQLADGAVTARSIAPGSIGAAQLAPNAAAESLRQSGGLVLSDQPNATNLAAAGYQKFGTVMSDADQWQTLGAFTPAARYGHVTVWTGREMLVWGGSGATRQLADGARYDPSTDTWTPTAPAIASASSARAVLAGRLMIVLTTSPRRNLAYDSVNNTWQTLSSVNQPSEISGQSLIWTGGELLVWGGLTNQGARYDSATDTWTTLTNPQPSVGAVRAGHSAVWTGTEMIVWGGYRGDASLNTGLRYAPATGDWKATSVKAAPTARYAHTAVWTGAKMIVWGGTVPSDTTSGAPTGGIYDPVTDIWKRISTNGAPPLQPGHAAFWTGSEMLVWGYARSDQSPTSSRATYRSATGRYNPETDTWRPIAAPDFLEATTQGSAVWTGSALLVWGGRLTTSRLSPTPVGAIYRADADLWQPISSAPQTRADHTAVWTGDELIIWGGVGLLFNPSASDALGSGARLAPASGRWSPLSVRDAPTPRFLHGAVWTGSEMIVWGGQGVASRLEPSGQPLNSGGRYRPATDSWKPMSPGIGPDARFAHSMIWSGDEAIVFGGNTSVTPYSENIPVGSGARYRADTDTWSTLSRIGAPAPRAYHSAVWTGSQMIVWGGESAFSASSFAPLNTGGRYDPKRDAWSPMSTVDAPAGHRLQQAVWTGQALLVFSPRRATGSSSIQVARYDPAGDRWKPISGVAFPTQTETTLGFTAIWTREDAVLWGAAFARPGGGRFSPSKNLWTALATQGAPTTRTGHAAVWTGTEMLVTGGGLANASALSDIVLSYSLTRPLYLYRHP